MYFTKISNLFTLLGIHNKLTKHNISNCRKNNNIIQ